MEINQKEFKSGFVSLIGRTNVGKSTLLNLLVGEKVAAIANKVQTTRTAIKGIVNRENSQIIFVDTPGVVKIENELDSFMEKIYKEEIIDADIVLFMTDSSVDVSKDDLTLSVAKFSGLVVTPSALAIAANVYASFSGITLVRKN